MSLDALLDSNVVVAIVAEDHEHHEPSLALLAASKRANFAIAAHTYAEAFCTLTQRGDRAPFHFPPEDAWAALESVRAQTSLVGLTAAQIFDAVRDYAQRGGTGAQLYDRLIGETAVVHDIATLLTWNVGHMRGLFPQLTVCTPIHFARIHSDK